MDRMGLRSCRNCPPEPFKQTFAGLSGRFETWPVPATSRHGVDAGVWPGHRPEQPMAGFLTRGQDHGEEPCLSGRDGFVRPLLRDNQFSKFFEQRTIHVDMLPAGDLRQRGSVPER